MGLQHQFITPGGHHIASKWDIHGDIWFTWDIEGYLPSYHGGFSPLSPFRFLLWVIFSWDMEIFLLFVWMIGQVWAELRQLGAFWNVVDHQGPWSQTIYISVGMILRACGSFRSSSRYWVSGTGASFLRQTSLISMNFIYVHTYCGWKKSCTSW